jgi:hypothetical protein
MDAENFSKLDVHPQDCAANNIDTVFGLTRFIESEGWLEVCD